MMGDEQKLIAYKDIYELSIGSGYYEHRDHMLRCPACKMPIAEGKARCEECGAVPKGRMSDDPSPDSKRSQFKIWLRHIARNAWIVRLGTVILIVGLILTTIGLIEFFREWSFPAPAP